MNHEPANCVPKKETGHTGDVKSLIGLINNILNKNGFYLKFTMHNFDMLTINIILRSEFKVSNHQK